MEADAVSPPVVGSKARRLAELQRAGLPVPPFRSLPADLPRLVNELGFPLTVRSSADAEDGAKVSFAGQFKSFLNLWSIGEVRRAIEECMASARTASVAEYCRHHGLRPEELRMGVFVQRMIRPELAGVAFTVNPLTGAEEVVIEACCGLADQLLQGHQTGLPADHPLLKRYRPRIERLARSAQQVLGSPQDIEFAAVDGQVYLLQARPITRIHFDPGAGEWTNADFRDGGVSCGVCTPLMWSLYDDVWEHTLKGFLDRIKLSGDDFVAGRLFYGRPYWNLGAVKDRLARLPGFVEREFDRDLGIEPRYDGPGRITPLSIAGVVRALPTVWAIRRAWREQEQFDRSFLNGGFERLFAPCTELPSNTDTLHHLITGLYRTTESNYFQTIFCASLAKLDFTDAFPDADYAPLVSGLPNLAHLEPVEFLRTRHGEADIDEFIRRFPHRSRRELDIRAPRWDEDRPWVEQLFQAARLPGAPAQPHALHEQARADALERLRPWQRARFSRKLDRLRTFVWLREQMRDLSTRVYHLLRRCVLRIAEERRLGEDIFFMSWQEILADDRGGIAPGRAAYEGYRHFQAPNEIGSRYPFEPRDGSPGWQGLAASPGRVTGFAHVARTVEEAVRIQPGCVLVCPFTDPGWTPVLGRASAVVTETGGLLSHAAVICREFGIPAVLGVPQAVRRIQNETPITVDGAAGYVEVAR